MTRVGRLLGLRHSVQRSVARRVPLPPIARRVTLAEWGVVAVTWLALALTSAPTLADNARRSGIAVVYRDYLFLQAIDWIGWMLLLWPFFRMLDATPIAMPHRLRNAGVRVVLYLAVAAAHGLIVHTMLRLGHGPLGVSDAVWDLSVTTPAGMYTDDLVNAVFPMTVYTVLRRVHRRRIELAHAADLERSLLSARLHALDLELQPHFLFNTLNAIVALVRREPEQAERMLVTLSDLLRATLGRTGGEITLREELDQLDLYLDIQRIRFGDRLRIIVEVDVDVLDVRVPAMILQPLVENAITHGLAPKLSSGTITITGLRDGDGVALGVTDDGVGLPAGRPRERTGVRNTRERLRVLYGDSAATFTLQSRAGGGTEAFVRIQHGRREPLPDVRDPKIAGVTTRVAHRPEEVIHGSLG